MSEENEDGFISCNARIRGTHPYSFRTGEWADIIGVKICAPAGYDPRPAFQCIYADGYAAYIPISDAPNYELGS